MEYLKYHDTYDDIPIERILNAWYEVYRRNWVKMWKKLFEQMKGKKMPDFYTEDAVDS